MDTVYTFFNLICSHIFIFKKTMIILSCITIFSLACLLTLFLRSYALQKSLLDIPNHRSSHTIPTPRGGGIAFVVCFLLTLLICFYNNIIPANLIFSYFIGGFFIALLGFLDDRGHIPPLWRLMGHLLASGFALYLIGGMPNLYFLKFLPSWFNNILGLLYLMWLLNLYNFMDGIDGIAAIEALSVCLGVSLIYALLHMPANLILPLSLFCAVAGFLVWNFPPARIFMGDAGSSFLGFILGLMSLEAAKLDSRFFTAWLILLGIFIVDATYTLIRRALHKQKLYEGHRSHAYQKASLYYNSHLKVSTVVLVINLFWLLPLAILVSLGKVPDFIGLFLAYLPILMLVINFKAGTE